MIDLSLVLKFWNSLIWNALLNIFDQALLSLRTKEPGDNQRRVAGRPRPDGGGRVGVGQQWRLECTIVHARFVINSF